MTPLRQKNDRRYAVTGAVGADPGCDDARGVDAAVPPGAHAEGDGEAVGGLFDKADSGELQDIRAGSGSGQGKAAGGIGKDAESGCRTFGCFK